MCSANFDQDLATNKTILMEKARTKSSSEDKADRDEDENEDVDEDEMVVDKPTLSAGTTINYLDELRDFALISSKPRVARINQ